MYLTFEIVFPVTGWTDASNLSKLEKILPARKAVVLNGVEGEEAVMTVVDSRQQQHHEDEEYEDEDERGQQGGPGVQCAQQ